MEGFPVREHRVATAGALFDAAWAKGDDISDPAVVESVAVACGVPKSVVEFAMTPEGKQGLTAGMTAMATRCEPCCWRDV